MRFSGAVRLYRVPKNVLCSAKPPSCAASHLLLCFCRRILVTCIFKTHMYWLWPWTGVGGLGTVLWSLVSPQRCNHLLWCLSSLYVTVCPTNLVHTLTCSSTDHLSNNNTHMWVWECLWWCENENECMNVYGKSWYQCLVSPCLCVSPVLLFFPSLLSSFPVFLVTPRNRDLHLTCFNLLQEFRLCKPTVSSSTSVAWLLLNNSKAGLVWLLLRRWFYVFHLI
jgi:hypothetical protein